MTRRQGRGPYSLLYRCDRTALRCPILIKTSIYSTPWAAGLAAGNLPCHVRGGEPLQPAREEGWVGESKTALVHGRAPSNCSPCVLSFAVGRPGVSLAREGPPPCCIRRVRRLGGVYPAKIWPGRALLDLLGSCASATRTWCPSRMCRTSTALSRLVALFWLASTWMPTHTARAHVEQERRRQLASQHATIKLNLNLGVLCGKRHLRF